MLAMEIASLKMTMDSEVSLRSSSRKYIDDIPLDIRANLCTQIDYTIHKNEGYWQKLIRRLGFDETHSKKFRLSFEMHGSPTDNLLRDCSYRMLRIRHLYQVLTDIGLLHLAEAFLKDFDTEDPLPPYTPLFNGNTERSDFRDDFWNNRNTSKSKGIAWRGIDTYHFSFDEIQTGTKYFSPQMELGAGAFGKVYKVILNNTLFACKVLKIDKENQLTTSLIETHHEHDDLRNELNYLAEYRHPNVIALYGWSLDGPDPCLIYDYMKNGSLQDRLQCLNNSKPLDWEIRAKVSCGAARGLQFLHTMKSKPLIHGDIKTANILLDSSFTAKLGDFGLAREMPHSATTGSYIRLENEHTPGTLGYLATEYMVTKKLSVQVDTYAFGVVLLELYTGRRAYDRSKATPSLRDYMDDVAKEAEEIGQEKANEKLLRLQDPSVEHRMHEEAALKFVRIALSCCHEKRKERPKMSQTLEDLNDIERMVAIANGKEPEDSIVLPSQDRNPSQHPGLNLVPATGQSIVSQQRRMADSNLSRNPVESVDHSLVGDRLASKAEHLKSTKSDKPSHSHIEKHMDRLRLPSSSDDSGDISSADTTTSGFYFNAASYLPHDQVKPANRYQQPPSRHHPGHYAYYQGTHDSGVSGSVALPHSSDQYHRPSHIGDSIYPHGFVNGQNRLPLNDGHELFAAGPCSCPASQPFYRNPYNLDLSKVPRPACVCHQSQQPRNVSPLQSPSNWHGQVNCSPEPFSSLDYKDDPQSFVKQTQPLKSPGVRNAETSELSSMPGKSNLRPTRKESVERREASYYPSTATPLSQPNSFHFHPSDCGPGDRGYADHMHFSQIHSSVSAYKDSIIDKIKEGQSYTQIFSEKRIPTEDSSSETTP